MMSTVTERCPKPTPFSACSLTAQDAGNLSKPRHEIFRREIFRPSAPLNQKRKRQDPTGGLVSLARVQNKRRDFLWLSIKTWFYKTPLQ